MKKLFNNYNRGFTLVELMLSLAIASVALMSVTAYTAKMMEEKRAESAGEQFLEIGKALNNYIARESGNLLACVPANGTIDIPFYVLTQSTGSTVSGPCSLTHQQFLSPTVSQTNMLGTGYNIYIQKNSGTAVSGLVLSSTPITDSADPTTIRYDWIGLAMRKAGASSGMTFTGQPTSMKGLGGGWELTATDFSNINREGLMGYRVGYQANYDDIYMRLDGSYPMQGNFNMGNYNINNATDINFNGWLNGNNALLNNLKTGYISNSGNIQTDTLSAFRDITSGNDISATRDIIAGRNITSTNGDIAARSTGSTTTGRLLADNNIESTRGNIVTNNGNIIARRDPATPAGTTKGRVTAEEYVAIQGVATEGTYCDSSGNNLLLAKANGTGELLTCTNYRWSKMSGGTPTTFYEIGTFNRRLAGQCLAANITTGGCYCPAGTRQQMLVGFAYHWQDWDGTIMACIP